MTLTKTFENLNDKENEGGSGGGMSGTSTKVKARMSLYWHGGETRQARGVAGSGNGERLGGQVKTA